MGQVASQPAPSGFSAVWAALPEAAREETSALASKASTTLTRPHPAAPPPFPSVPVGVVVRIDHQAAQAALSLVPRLQQKHYESIRGAHTETHFWVNFFTHATQIVAHAAPHLLQHLVSAWKGIDGDSSANGFLMAWARMGDAQRASVAALAHAESEALLRPAAQAPEAFPRVPVGFEVFIDEAAARSALELVPQLQRKLYVLVPRKLDEATFWANFCSQVTAIVGPPPGPVTASHAA